MPLRLRQRGLAGHLDRQAGVRGSVGIVGHGQVHTGLEAVDNSDAGIAGTRRRVAVEELLRLVEVGEHLGGHRLLRCAGGLVLRLRLGAGEDDRTGQTFHSGHVRVLVGGRQVHVVDVVIHQGTVDIRGTEVDLLVRVQILNRSQRADDIVRALDDLVQSHERDRLAAVVGVHDITGHSGVTAPPVVTDRGGVVDQVVGHSGVGDEQTGVRDIILQLVAAAIEIVRLIGLRDHTVHRTLHGGSGLGHLLGGGGTFKRESLLNATRQDRNGGSRYKQRYNCFFHKNSS